MTNSQPALPDARTLAGGVAWIGALRWSAQILNWLSTLVVIRLLSPEDYGIVGMATVFIGVAAVLSEFGLGSAVVALPALDSREVAELNGGAVLLSIVMAIVALLSAPLLAHFFNEPALRLVVPVLSLGFVLEGIRTVPVAMLSRRLAYRSTAMLDFGRQAGSAVLVLALAWLGTGYWALVGGNLGGSLVATLWVLAIHRQPLAVPRLAHLARPLTYARHILGSRIAWQAYRNSDFLIAGRLFGADLLGYYTVAWNLASLPGEKLGNIITAATGPFFAAIQHDRAALRHHFLRVTEMLSLIILPVLVGFLLVADLAVPLLLGDRWMPAVTPLRLLIGYAAVQAVVSPVSQVLNVTGNTRTSMLSGVLALLVLPPTFLVGAHFWGINGIALGWLATYPLLTLYPLGRVRQALSLPFLEYLRAWRRAVEGVIWLLALALLVGFLMPPGLPEWARLVALIIAGAGGYLACIGLRHRSVVANAIQLVRRRKSAESSTGS
ncbi:MAG: lipopolysaccharide biosynthesis protein [Gemmatimonadota bacterium]|nr:lipopolysaccharide biosynthesis protein [Gemmatimonadota bacterium]